MDYAKKIAFVRRRWGDIVSMVVSSLLLLSSYGALANYAFQEFQPQGGFEDVLFYVPSTLGLLWLIRVTDYIWQGLKVKRERGISIPADF